MPTFSELIKNGSHGTLISTLPPNTLPAWTSIFTGVNPGKHGITDFRIREGSHFKIANNNQRMVDAIWTILSRFNLKQLIISEPVTYPPEKINGIMLTGFFTPFQNKNFAYPSSIKDEINKVCHEYEPDLPFGFEKTIAADKTKGFELINEFAKKTFKATKYLANNYDWSLLSTTFASTDRLQHFYFSESNFVRSHYELIDRFLNEILNIESNVNAIVVSDHGFGPLEKCFYINTWLKEHGLTTEHQNPLNTLLSCVGLTYNNLVSTSSKIGLYKPLAKIMPKRMKRSIPRSAFGKNMDFNKSAAFFTGLNSGLFIKKGVNKQQASLLKKNLLSLKINGERPIEQVFRREEVVWGPYTHRAADIFLVPKYGYEISHRILSPCISKPSAFGDIRTGTHRQKGIFMAYGSDIKRGFRLKQPLFTWDIAPTILHMFNLSIPTYFDGRVLQEIFKNRSDPANRLVKTMNVSEQERLSRRLNDLKKAHKKRGV